MATAILDETRSAGNSVPPAPLTPISTLPFNDFPVPLYEHEDQTWIAGLDLGKCLGYKKPSGAILNIFNRHKDELNPLSTHLILRGEGGKIRTQRAYNEQGAYIVAMFATTHEAKDVRLWLSQLPRRMRGILIRQQPPTPSEPVPTGTLTVAHQQELKELVQAKASAYPDAVKRKVFSQIWMRIQRKFKVPRYEELPVALFGEARDYVIAMQIRSVAAPVLEGSEPKSLPSVRRRNTLDGYKAMYRELPDSPQHWLRLITETFHATEAFGNKLDAIKAEATKPFRSGRTSDVSSYFDASMSPIYDLFSIADEQLRLTYRCVYNALEGCRNTWLLLNKG